jgi:hypothetical protein
MPVKQTYRSHAEVMRFFGGLEMVEPGLTPVQKWRPDSAAGGRDTLRALGRCGPQALIGPGA